MRLINLFENTDRITPEVLTKVILQTRREFIDQGQVKCINDIGDGHCENFVHAVYENLEPYGFVYREDYQTLGELDTSDFWSDDFFVDVDALRKAGERIPDGVDEQKLGDVLGGATHMWIAYQGKHYDAEAPKGVDRFLELPFFQRYMNQFNNSLTEAVSAFHGSRQDDVVFDPTHLGDNSHTFGAYQSKRTGVFFSDNPEYSAMYGKVQQYELNIQNTATDMAELAFHAAGDLDAHDPEERPLWIDLMGISRSSEAWPLFEDEVGDYFVPWLVAKGFDSAQFEEYSEDDHGQEHRSITTVVFDPSKIKRLPDPQLTESFFSDNSDALMPIVRGLMKTAARPLIYKVWKKAPNAVLALAAIKKLHDQGDPHPLVTLDTLSDLDVPMQFLKRLAWEAGLHDIPGVPESGKKPNLMPMTSAPDSPYARQRPAAVHEDAETRTVYHVTPTENLQSIRQQGLVPQIGQNSAEWGETEDAIHVFYNWDNMEDAIANWPMSAWGEEDEVPLTAIELKLPVDAISEDPSYPKMIGLVKDTIPPSSFVKLHTNV